jgi:hypothetical protein
MICWTSHFYFVEAQIFFHRRSSTTTHYSGPDDPWQSFHTNQHVHLQFFGFVTRYSLNHQKLPTPQIQQNTVGKESSASWRTMVKLEQANSNVFDEISPTFSAEDFDDIQQLKMLEQLKIRKNEAVARLLKQPNDDDSVITKDTEPVHSEEYGSSDLADDDIDPANKDPSLKKLSFQDILDYTEQRQDLENYRAESIHRYLEEEVDKDDQSTILYVTSSLTDDSYEKAWSHAQELWKQAGMTGEFREVAEYSNYPRQNRQPQRDSVASLEMLFNHLTCNARDTITWADWKAWSY